jgi:hypothetical protein
MFPEIFLLCALALPPAGAFRPALTSADTSFFEFLRSMDYDNLHFVHGRDPWQKLIETVAGIRKGGILLVDKKYGVLIEYFKGRDFMRLPFTWRTYYIFRRRGSSA